MAINTSELQEQLKESLRSALNKGILPIPENATPEQIEIREDAIAMLHNLHNKIATEFGLQASAAIEAFVTALEINLTKTLEVNVPAGQDVKGLQQQGGQVSNKIGETSTPAVGSVPADQTNIGKLV